MLLFISFSLSRRNTNKRIKKNPLRIHISVGSHRIVVHDSMWSLVIGVGELLELFECCVRRTKRNSNKEKRMLCNRKMANVLLSNRLDCPWSRQRWLRHSFCAAILDRMDRPFERKKSPIERHSKFEWNERRISTNLLHFQWLNDLPRVKLTSVQFRILYKLYFHFNSVDRFASLRARNCYYSPLTSTLN